MYKKELVLNQLQGLVYCKTQANKQQSGTQLEKDWVSFKGFYDTVNLL